MVFSPGSRSGSRCVAPALVVTGVSGGESNVGFGPALLRNGREVVSCRGSEAVTSERSHGPPASMASRMAVIVAPTDR